MNKKILGIGIIFLFIVSVITPMTVGYNIKQSIENETKSTISENITLSSKVFNFAIINGKTCYAFCVFDPSGQLDNGPLRFESDNPSNLTPLAQNSHYINGGCYVSPSAHWYVCDCDANIWVITDSTFNMRLIGHNDVVLNALANDEIATNTLYGASNDELFEVNRKNGSLSLIGSFNIPDEGNITGLACDYVRLYGIGVDSDSLYFIDKQTGNATLIGTLGIDITNQSDLEYDFENGFLYLSAFTTQGEFYSVNTFNGECTLVGVFQGGAHITGLAIPYYYEPRPPLAPIIYGPHNGKIGVAYEYTLFSSDPNGDDISYYIDWGDGNRVWTNYSMCGIQINVWHTWNKKGIYLIMAKAKDTFGLESGWTIFIIKILKTRNIELYGCYWLRLFEQFPLLQKLLFLLK